MYSVLKYMFNVSICEYFSVLNVFIVCICNTTLFKLIPLLCTHVYSYMFSTMHPPRGIPLYLFTLPCFGPYVQHYHGKVDSTTIL